ncbi:putative protease of the Abi (CAAX) family [Rubidibacter lacunae KORDI 51-2]|uniref:Putative protease of the Abi (CAAX) family n=1 Tax=Rubidibacter lacunae KORDI 51-2 TaxID=582515 RepID=U5DGL5_9CHRO|nr:polysaccharide deacetylase family protein [Rubidibacter lacunae]ERN40746.1 putative protease of the Abi (CAAX) family [Rubidibacter lacunae KORDI 51-2]
MRSARQQGIRTRIPPWSKRILALGAVCIAIVAILVTQPHWAVRPLAPFICPSAIYAFETDTPAIALTIDDTPNADPAITTAILDLLAAEHVRATFFVIADNITPANRPLLKRMATEHEIGNHLATDNRSIALGSAAFAAEVERFEVGLANLSHPRWLRPGGGFCDRVMAEIARDRGYELALASVWPYDTFGLLSQRRWFPAFATWQLGWGDRSGAILVLHDGGKRGAQTLAVLKQVLAQFEDNYRFVTLSDLAAASNSKVEVATEPLPNWLEFYYRRLLLGVITPPPSSAWRGLVLFVWLPAAGVWLWLGFRSGWLTVELAIPRGRGLSSIGFFLWTPIRVFFVPSFAEECLMRGLLLPSAAELANGAIAAPTAAQLFAQCLGSLAIYVFSHPLVGALIDRLSRNPDSNYGATFRQPVFLVSVAVLGSASTVTFLETHSLWPPVLIHALVVSIWLLFLGGDRQLNGKPRFKQVRSI